MRIKFSRLVAFIVLFANIIVIYYSLRLFIAFNNFKSITSSASASASLAATTKTKSPSSSSSGSSLATSLLVKAPLKHISKLITIIIRDFELNENDVSATIQSFLNIFPNIQILILYNNLPYPPLKILDKNDNSNNTSAKTLKNIRAINLTPDLKTSFNQRSPLNYIKTKFVLFVPDATRITSRQQLQVLLTELLKVNNNNNGANSDNGGCILVGPVGKKELNCLRVNINVKEWTLKYSLIKGNECDAVNGKHVVLLETDVLKKLSEAFLLPFPQSLYIQTAALNVKVKIIRNASFHDGKLQPRPHHTTWRRRQLDSERAKTLYTTFKFKLVTRESGTSEWYGCNRDTPRCFSRVLASMPSYLFEGRWTPPCCLSNLRKTAKHVFNHLEEVGIRYWLEAGSLLGAMRSGDILPWDHDVDIGFNRDDLNRSPWLLKAKDKSVIDTKGFLWEKATEGNFFRCYYSKVNKIHVNLFPFFTRNGTMTKDSWYTHHKNMEFPDNFLHPMSSIDFIGRQVPSPNNIRDFLELKFGKGAIENPEYPDPGRLPFP